MLSHRTPTHALPARDPHVAARDQARLAGQNLRILELLLREPRVPNFRLARIALKYTSRVSDIRAAGYLVVCTPDEAREGVNWYSARDLRTTPRAGFSVTTWRETRTVVAVRADRKGRRWVIYKTAARMGVTRILLSTWRAWAWSEPLPKRARKEAA